VFWSVPAIYEIIFIDGSLPEPLHLAPCSITSPHPRRCRDCCGTDVVEKERTGKLITLADKEINDTGVEVDDDGLL